MDDKPVVAVIGSGSWATAITKILHENVGQVHWFIRNEEIRRHLEQHGHNPTYISSIQFDMSKIRVTGDINEAVQAAEVVFVVVPSAYLPVWLEDLKPESLGERFVVTAVKGIVPKLHLTATEYIHQHFAVPYSKMGVISGPCHAEEVALERLSYLTFSCKDMQDASRISAMFRSFYIHTIRSTDIYGTEYSAIIKNIYAVAAGMAHGLGYGDNFEAVLACNGQAELMRFLNTTYPAERDPNASAYLGDLLVTCYSQFSRNRTFGTMIGKGYTVLSAQMEMRMVAEGYYATEGIHALNANYGVSMPIAEAMYSVLYNNSRPGAELRNLIENFV